MPTMQFSHSHVSPYPEWMPGSSYPRSIHVEAWLSSELSSLKCPGNTISNCPPVCRYPHMESFWVSPCNNSDHPGKTRHGLDRRLVNLLELTIPTNTYKALQAARIRKSEKPLYLQLVSDLEDRGLSVSFQTLKIGSLGHITPYAVKYLTSTFSLSKQHVLSKLSKISIACSYHIFNSRNSLSLTIPSTLCSYTLCFVCTVCNSNCFGVPPYLPWQALPFGSQLVS